MRRVFLGEEELVPGDGWGGGDSSAARLRWGGRERVGGPGGEGEMTSKGSRCEVLRVSESCDFSRRSSDSTANTIQRRTDEQVNQVSFSRLLPNFPEAFDYVATSSVLVTLVPIETVF